MDLLRKNFGALVKAVGDPGADGKPTGEIEAIVSVFGNTDLGREVVVAGAFTKSLSRKLPKGVWGHDWAQPVARTEEAKELFSGDPRLPEAIRDLGGLYIRGRFNLDTQRGREAYSDIAFGIVDEFSIGYRVLRAHRVTEEGEEQEDDPFGFFGPGAKSTRYLDEVELYEWSPVLVGMNPATSVLGVKAGSVAPLTDLLTHSKTQMAAILDEARALLDRRVKEGRTFSSANVAALEGYATEAEGIASGIRSLVTTAKGPERATDADADADAEKAAVAPPPDGAALFAEFQRITARLQGVAV